MRGIKFLGLLICVAALSGCSIRISSGSLDKSEEAKPGQQATTTQTTQSQNGTVTKTEQVHTKTSVDAGVGQVNVDLKAPIKTTVDCGDENCFAKKFAACEPAVLEAGIEGFASYRYEIIGPKSGKCLMKSKYTVNPNPDWVNKEMTCLYDNKLTLEKSSDAVFGAVYIDKTQGICTGPLADILLGVGA
jgi:uncharacterized protein YceK